MERDTPGKRLYAIRLACGDGVRRPEPMKVFVKRVKKATGETYDTGAVSLLERDLQGWRLKDMIAFATVDPAGRGAQWLGFGARDRESATPDPSRDTMEADLPKPKKRKRHG